MSHRILPHHGEEAADNHADEDEEEPSGFSLHGTRTVGEIKGYLRNLLLKASVNRAIKRMPKMVVFPIND